MKTFNNTTIVCKRSTMRRLLSMKLSLLKRNILWIYQASPPQPRRREIWVSMREMIAIYNLPISTVEDNRIHSLDEPFGAYIDRFGAQPICTFSHNIIMNYLLSSVLAVMTYIIVRLQYIEIP